MMPAPAIPALLTRWRSYLDVAGEPVECDWDELFLVLSHAGRFHGDTKHPGWSPARFDPVTRKDEHVRELSALVLDYDGTASVEGARDVWAPYYGIIHTTRKHTEAVHRFRVILALSRRCTPAEHAKLWSWANERAHQARHALDASTRNVGRFWYLPGVPDGAPFEAHRLTGAPLDVDAILRAHQERREPPKPDRPRESSLVVRIRRASHYIAKMDPAIAGSGGHVATFKVALVLTRGFDLPEDVALDLLAREYNPRCSPAWSDRELEHKVRTAANDGRVPLGYLLDDEQRDYHSAYEPHTGAADDYEAEERAAIEDDAQPNAEPAGRKSIFAKLDAPAIFEPLPPVPWLVEKLDLTPGAPAMFAGYGYSRKTLAAQALALSIAAGRRIWGEFACRSGRVLHIDYEQGNRLSRERYQRLALGMGISADELAGRIELVVLPRTYLDDPRAASIFAAEFEGYDCVIIDSFRAATPSADENSSDVRKHLDTLTRASEATGALPIVIHHSRKAGEGKRSAREALRGSSGIFDACSSVFVFSAEKGEPTLVEHEKARTSGELCEDFYLDSVDHEQDGNPRAGVRVIYKTLEQVKSGQPDESPLARLRSAILEAVRSEGEVKSKNVICGLVRGGNKALRLEAIDELLAAGMLVSLGPNGGGPYRVKG